LESESFKFKRYPTLVKMYIYFNVKICIVQYFLTPGKQ